MKWNICINTTGSNMYLVANDNTTMIDMVTGDVSKRDNSFKLYKIDTSWDFANIAANKSFEVFYREVGPIYANALYIMRSIARVPMTVYVNQLMDNLIINPKLLSWNIDEISNELEQAHNELIKFA